MEGHQVARIGRLDRAPQHLPRLGILIAERIAAVEPDDVRLVPVALGEEAAVDLCACGVELAARGERAPRSASVVKGKSVSVRVDLGGRRLIYNNIIKIRTPTVTNNNSNDNHLLAKQHYR